MKKATMPPGLTGVNYDYQGQPNIEHNAEVLIRDYLGTYWTPGVADKMRADPTIASVLNMIMFPMLRRRPIIDAASADEADQKVAAVVDAALNDDQSWHDKLYHDLLGMLVYGFAPYCTTIEPMLVEPKDAAGQWLTIRMHARKPNTIYEWERDSQTQKLIRAIQWVEGQYYDLDAAQLIVSTYRREYGMITGRAFLREMYSPYRNKLKLLIISLINAERFGGLPVIEGFDPSVVERTRVEDLLANIRVHQMAYLALPEGFGTFRFASPDSGASGVSYIDLLNHFDNQIYKTALLQFVQLGTGQGGSYNLAETLSDQSAAAWEFLAEQIARPYNQPLDEGPSIVRRIVDLNFAGVKQLPTWRLPALRSVDAARLETALRVITSARSLGAADELMVRQQLEQINDEILEEMEEREEEPETVPEVGEETEDEEENAEDEDQKEGAGEEPTTMHSHVHHLSAKVPRFDREWTASREPRSLEKFVAFRDLDHQMNTYSKRTVRAIEDYAAEVLDDYATACIALATDSDLVGLRKARVPEEARAAIMDALAPILGEAWQYGRETVQRELSVQMSAAKVTMASKKKVIKNEPITDYGDLVAGMTEADALAIAARLDAMWDTAEMGVQSAVIAQLRTGAIDAASVRLAALTSLPKTVVDDTAGLAVSVTINGGREQEAEVRKDKISYAEYSAMLDESVCDVCSDLDGQTWTDIDQPAAMTPNGDCLGGIGRCRCITIYGLKL